MNFLLLLASAALLSPGAPAPSPALPAAQGWPLPTESEGWRTDPVWWDGLAEKCVYDATRSIYGQAREYRATAYTNKQQMDARTTTKSSSDTGVECFKHHWSERVPTERYDYDFSTATFTRTGDLKPFKLTAATQEDCGASFKSAWRDGRKLHWVESVYFPDAGFEEGELDAADDLHFTDALTLLLRDYPFETAGGEVPAIQLALVPSQRDTHSVPFAPVKHEVRYGGRETLELPVGTVDAHRLELASGSGVVARYWFAADGGAPWLHALVRYEGPGGVTFRLRSIERTAYWRR